MSQVDEKALAAAKWAYLQPAEGGGFYPSMDHALAAYEAAKAATDGAVASGVEAGGEAFDLWWRSLPRSDRNEHHDWFARIAFEAGQEALAPPAPEPAGDAVREREPNDAPIWYSAAAASAWAAGYNAAIREIEAAQADYEARIRSALSPTPPPVVEAGAVPGDNPMQRLLTAAKMLYANAEGCAVNHYGDDFAIYGLPGWLTDCAADIRAAQAALAKPAPEPAVDAVREALKVEIKEYTPAGGPRVMIWVNDRMVMKDGYCIECVPRHVAPIIAAALAASPGWVLVPIEPTEAMHAAAEREWDGRMSARSRGVWQAMLAASRAPQGDAT